VDKPLRIVYAAGPGDVIGTYRHWSAGHDDPSQVAVTYSGQFYDFCRENQAAGYVISSHSRKEKLADGNYIIEHRPTFFHRGPGPLYHLGQILSGLRLVMSAVRFRADFAIVADGAHWFVLGLMPWFGVRVVPTLHCVLWPKHKPPGGFVHRMIRRLNARFFRRRVTAVMSLSNDITEQVREMLDGAEVPIIPFLPTYRPESFGDGFGPPSPPPPFKVFFAGRIEKNKGVFDLLAIAQQFTADGHTDIEFDLCGDGSQLEPLRQATLSAGLQDRFRLHGHSTKPFMRQMYEQCHAVIVPTTSDFVEGFNKVVAEAVLAGRPVITSSVCPALEYVREAVMEVPPDQPAAYGEAILKLKSDPSLYETKRLASASVRRQFYDPHKGWNAALEKAVGPSN
jgi:glycosyltransferase involved in cell wall biosynthesis